MSAEEMQQEHWKLSGAKQWSVINAHGAQEQVWSKKFLFIAFYLFFSCALLNSPHPAKTCAVQYGRHGCV